MKLKFVEIMRDPFGGEAPADEKLETPVAGGIDAAADGKMGECGSGPVDDLKFGESLVDGGDDEARVNGGLAKADFTDPIADEFFKIGDEAEVEREQMEREIANRVRALRRARRVGNGLVISQMLRLGIKLPMVIDSTKFMQGLADSERNYSGVADFERKCAGRYEGGVEMKDDFEQVINGVRFKIGKGVVEIDPFRKS